ncbi:glycerophosphoryl diester phosphodiesterase [Leuconostoc gelidum subsp. aenigmaticum]|uniref:glycerophosphodiester phosphodiesterase family protein n=1 Tax=Leuconostoc gelidum TaxID=1244 RepID=UPI001CC4D30F|nr:glycerophosphodiester phosphodiesterase family protein [Leuconostoc gelidum]MBZ6002921.1 glycerophosphoryl diester phosphodiesterase [Leuconostoc gelidum subsp. aenigmaticum]
MKKIAHRGISAQAPENTRAAFEKMVALNVEWLETDIDMTSDGELILIHDDKVDRVSNGSGSVNDMTLIELQKLDFGRWFGEAYANERIVTLKWLIDFINHYHFNVNFELKTALKSDKQNAYLTSVCQALRQVSSKVKIIVSSFDMTLLKKFHVLMPDVQIGVLIEGKLPDNIVAIAKNIGAVYVHPDVDYLTKEQTKKLIDNHLQVNVWTVNDMIVAEKLEKWRVEAIFTDFPEVKVI